MDTKVCFKCKIEKPISSFYKHSRMSDGHLNKCKECTKADVKNGYNKNIAGAEWKDKERKRGRDKYKRLYRFQSKAKPENNKRWMEKYPEKRKAQLASQHLLQPFELAEKHHWSYNNEHFKDVIWLLKQEHKKGHRFIVYDQERKMYRRYDNNELLDTRESHELFIRWCIENKED